MDAHRATTQTNPEASRTFARACFWLAAVAVAIVRLHQCARLPYETGDIVRHLLYGIAVGTRGIASAAEPLTRLYPAWSAVAWANFPYNYPPLTLAFFTLVASVSPSVFAAKLALSAIEVANACLVKRISGSAWLALVYWASPLSIWWVSGEGQFEPLQALFMLLAIASAASMPFMAGFSIALGVSTKATAAAVAPWAFEKTSRISRRAVVFCAIGFALGVLPILFSQWAYDGIYNIAHYSSLLLYNPYYWNPFAPMFDDHPLWQNVANEIASYGYLAALIVCAWHTRAVLPCLAALAFLVFCKMHSNVQPWYWLLMPAFLMTIRDARWRFALVVLCPLLDLNSVYELLHGAIGPNRFHGLPSAFAPYGVD